MSNDQSLFVLFSQKGLHETKKVEKHWFRLTRNVMCSLTVRDPMKMSSCNMYPAMLVMDLAFIFTPLTNREPDFNWNEKVLNYSRKSENPNHLKAI